MKLLAYSLWYTLLLVILQISVNGVISFGEHFPLYSPELLPGTTAAVHYAYLVAPYWVDGDLRRGGNITWEVLVAGSSSVADDYLTQVSEFVEDQQNTTFVGNWLMIVNFNKIPPFLSVSLKSHHYLFKF